MDYKKTNAPTNTQTQDIKKLEEGVENVYEASVIIAKRANQISKELKDELNQKLEEFASYTDNLEEIFENKEQIEISKFYERLPKPTLIALQEYLDGKIYFRSPETGNENIPDNDDQ
jgi:DNA-directed RNA polymerase subunit K/omega